MHNKSIHAPSHVHNRHEKTAVCCFSLHVMISTTVTLQYVLHLGHCFSSMVVRQPPPPPSLSLSLSLSLSPSSLSLCPHLCVFSTSGQAAYEAAHVFHTPLAYVLHRVCCGRVLPIHEKTSHRAWESSSGWKWCVNINTGYRAAVQAEDPATVSDAADTHLKVNFVIFILSSFVTYDEFEEDTF